MQVDAVNIAHQAPGLCHPLHEPHNRHRRLTGADTLAGARRLVCQGHRATVILVGTQASLPADPRPQHTALQDTHVTRTPVPGGSSPHWSGRTSGTGHQDDRA